MVFELFQKLCEPIFDVINYSTFFCFFESGKCKKEEKRMTKTRPVWLNGLVFIYELSGCELKSFCSHMKT